MANNNTSYFEQCFVNVRSTFITDPQPSKLMQPGQRPFHDPAEDAQSTAMSGPSFRKNRFYSFVSKLFSMRLGIITPVALNIIRFAAWPANLSRNRRNRIHQRQQLSDIVAICAGQSDCKRDAFGVGDNMMLRTHFSSIRGIRAGFRPPKTARTEPESTNAREKSIWSARRSLLSKIWWILLQTPAFCQSRSRRQQVIPEPQPISCGRYSQGMPVLSTNRIPVNASRLLTVGLPPLGFFFNGGKRGSMSSHNSSDNSGLAIVLPSLANGPSLFFNHPFHRPFHYLKMRFCYKL